MAQGKQQQRIDAFDPSIDDAGTADKIGARTLVQARYASIAPSPGALAVQRKSRTPVQMWSTIGQAAEAGVTGASAPLPFADRIQAAFGRHDVGSVRTATGGVAQEACTSMGALAYATGDQVAFAGAPDLHTAAHEAAHVIQQRGGVSLKSGVGEVGDAYEQHADRVADLVVAGQSAEAELDQMAGGGGSPAVQKLDDGQGTASTGALPTGGALPAAGGSLPATGGASAGPAPSDTQRAVDAILAADPNAPTVYASYVLDPLSTIRTTLFGRLVLDWQAWANCEATCRHAATRELTGLQGEDNPDAARIGQLSMLPGRATMAMFLIRTVAPLSDAELQPVLDGVRTDATLAKGQAFVAGAFAGFAQLAAKRLYEMELAKAIADGKPQKEAERQALGVYTRAMPAGQTQEDIAASREAYTFTLPVGGQEVPVRTPYHISTRLGQNPTPHVPYSEADVKAGDPEASARKRVAFGKGTAAEVEEVMEEHIAADYESVATNAKTALDNADAAAAGASIEQWMSDHDIGVDCSGFAFEATAGADAGVAAGWEGRNPGMSMDQISWDKANVSNAKKLENSEPIPVSACRPGDLVINSSTKHIGVIEVPPVQVPVTDIPEDEGRRATARGKLGIGKDDEATTMVFRLGIAHSADVSGDQGGTDAPGPHLGTYWFSEAGTRLTQVDEVMSSFATFHRPLLAPPV